MDIEWTRCLWKINQILGGAKRRDTVAIFVNKNYIGTHAEFREYLISEHNIVINLWSWDYKRSIRIDTRKHHNDDKMTFVRMVFEFNHWEIGHVIFALFDRLVPKTCNYFKQLCLDKAEGYTNTSIFRVDVSNGFIQAGRIIKRMAYLKKENFSVNHDRRGVLSLASRHTYFNGPEFIISLQPNPWMNNKYVAFGRAVEGEETLKTVEKLSGKNDTFDRGIRIIRCDVVPDRTTRRHRTTTIDAHLLSAFRETVARAMYVRLYGRPEPLHRVLVADSEYMRSIVKTAIRTVLGGIRDRSARPTAAGKSANRRSVSACDGDVGPRSTAPDRCVLAPFSRASPRHRLDGIGLQRLGIERTALAEPKFADTSKMPTGRYGVRLPPNHKDFWKSTKIYESIAK